VSRFEYDLTTRTGVCDCELGRVGLIFHLLQDALLLFGQHASFVEIFNLKIQFLVRECRSSSKESNTPSFLCSSFRK